MEKKRVKRRMRRRRKKRMRRKGRKMKNARRCKKKKLKKKAPPCLFPKLRLKGLRRKPRRNRKSEFWVVKNQSKGA